MAKAKSFGSLKYMDKKEWKQKTDLEKKIWKREDDPLRILTLWGWDKEHNPGFLFLYGRHQFDEKKSTKDITVLKEDVTYEYYAVFKGKQGHFPSFPNVKLEYSMEEMYYTTRLYIPNYYWYYNTKEKEAYKVQEYKKIASEKKITLPYFSPLSYEETVKQVESILYLEDFQLVKNPEEILQLDGKLSSYYDLIFNMINKHNIYMRKKYLNNLIEQNPPKEVYDLLFKIGSSELISGIFLEFAKRKYPLLLEEAKTFLSSSLDWTKENYAKGIKRCANIYQTMFYPDLKEERVDWILNNYKKIDLHVALPKESRIPVSGLDYRNYAYSGGFQEYRYQYNWQERSYKKKLSPIRYEKGPYTDGRNLDKIALKNTIQEAELYEFPEIIGKIAYYLDAPRLTYYFRGRDDSKSLSYFRRYIKRILNSYAENNPEYFIRAIKVFCISYKEIDYVGIFPNNFQFNELLKYYLYYDFKEENEDWRWFNQNDLMEIEGRYELRKDIWDNHLKDVIKIAIKTEIDPIKKACYYILKDHIQNHDFFSSLSIGELIALAQSSYKPLSVMFLEFLKERLDTFSAFDVNIMLAMMETSSKDLHKLAAEFMKKTNGYFLPSALVDFLFFKNFEEWIEVFKESLLSLKEEEYVQFIEDLLERAEEFKEKNIVWSKEVKDIFSISANKIPEISFEGKQELFSYLTEKFFENPKIPEQIEEYIEEIVFAFSYKELEEILEKVNISDKKQVISQRNARIVFFLKAIQKKSLPSDGQIIEILETGSSKMIKILLEMISDSDETLKERFATLLIMLESDVVLLNIKAKEVFEKLPLEKREKMHMMLIDSPVEKVYQYGLKKLEEFYYKLPFENGISKEFLTHMLEHPSSEVKSYISNKIFEILENYKSKEEEIFLYYVKTLLLLPNKVSKSKDRVYKAIPLFVLAHKNRQEEIEELLLEVGSSNNIIDSERALVTLAQIRKEVLN